MFLIGQASGFLQSIFFAFTLDVKRVNDDGTPRPEADILLNRQNRVWWTFFAMICVASVSFFVSLFIKEDLKRMNFGKDQNVNNNGDADKE